MADLATVAVALRPHLLDALFPPGSLDRLEAVAEVRRHRVITDWAADGVDELIGDATVLLTGWGCPRVDAAVLDRAPRLTAVVHAAGTVKSLIAPEVWARGIQVSSAADANAVPVAEFTVAAIVLAAKRTFRHVIGYREGLFPANDPAEDTGANGLTIGVVGASRIGRMVLARLASHDARLLLSDPYLTAGQATALGAELVDLDELCRRSDVVTLHAPSLPQTRHLFDDRRLSLLRNGAVLINTARGSLVDTEALTLHCATGRLDAVLDVTDPEPLPVAHPLFAMPNVLVTPHLAGARGNELRRLGDYAIAEIARLARGEELLGLIHPGDLGRLA